VGTANRPPTWIKPQLTRLVDEAPVGDGWLHEIKYDGYRMHARIDGRDIKLLTRTGLDWSHRYRRTIEALHELKVKSAYLDGELCALNADGAPVFSRLQAAMDEGRTDQLVFFAFDLLFLNGQSTAELPLAQRKDKLKRLFRQDIVGLRYSDHVAGDGPRFHQHACKLGLEGAVSKRANQPYAPADRRLPDVARACLAALGSQLRALKAQILEFDRCIIAWHRSNSTSRQLVAPPGVGPALAIALVASVADPTTFQSGRNFSACDASAWAWAAFLFGPMLTPASRGMVTKDKASPGSRFLGPQNLCTN
jgi:hypothetical protein